ncbi:SCAN domain-containing protein 3-like [Tachypleus tridentatus]|uniref:SCAN domain-containing protein 3-like n=1 Tax=Tachypleus tridentatus TaxID=6853 RepID=UPI003FD1B79B
MAAPSKKKCRQYSVEYLSYGFIPTPHNETKPMCLICMDVLSNDSMKPCKLKIHLEKKHTGEKDKPLEYFKKLRDDFQARKTVSQLFNSKVCKMSDGLLASYEISKIIAKAGKPHNVGETVILPAVSVIISSVMKQNASEITNSIPLSNSSVSRRIDEMAEDVEKQLIAHLQVKQFALQLDESTLRDNEAILLAYVRFNNDERPKEEMLFARSLVTDTKGETIFNEVVTYFQENNIPLKNIIACATDGAPSMTGRYKGFIAHLKKLSRKYFLQGKDSDLIYSKSAIAAFLRKLQLYKNNIRRRAFEQFPCLASVSSDLQDENLALYGEYMENMHEDMQTRFSDLLMMVIPTWVSIPFEVSVADIDISLQKHLIELQSDEIMRAKFKDENYNVWKTKDVATKYPLLWDKAQLYVIAFPTSYLVESGFSRVSQLLSKARNRLDIVKRGDLRLSLTSMEPDIKKLAEQHQPQGSH